MFAYTDLNVFYIITASISVVILLMTGTLLYLSTYFTKKNPNKTMLFVGLYFLTTFTLFEMDDIAMRRDDKINEPKWM